MGLGRHERGALVQSLGPKLARLATDCPKDFRLFGRGSFARCLGNHRDFVAVSFLAIRVIFLVFNPSGCLVQG